MWLVLLLALPSWTKCCMHFLKSSCSRTWSGGALEIQDLALCIMVSAPDRHPTPSWSGASAGVQAGWYRFTKHLPANLRMSSPTAIGRTPPSFLPMGIRRALARIALASGFSLPQAKSLQMRASCSRTRSYAGESLLGRCEAVNPENPPADPGGNVRRHSATSSVEKSSPIGLPPTGRVGQSFRG